MSPSDFDAVVLAFGAGSERRFTVEVDVSLALEAGDFEAAADFGWVDFGWVDLRRICRWTFEMAVTKSSFRMPCQPSTP